MSAVQQIGFVVDGSVLTDLVRTLWADEGEPEKAIHILKAGFPDMPEEAVYGILTGHKKLEGDSAVGITLVDDNVSQSQYGNSLALEDVLKPFRKQYEEGLDAMDLLIGNVEHVASPQGRVAIPRRRVRDFKSGKVKLDEMRYRGVQDLTAKERRELMESPSAERQRQEIGLELDDVDDEEPRREPPKPEYKITEDYGWLSPDGKFYRCAWMEHIWFADVLGHTERELEKLGWIKIEDGEAFAPEREATQRQINLIFDWYTEQGKELPYWWERD